MPEMGFKPVNKYLPPRARRSDATVPSAKPSTSAPPPDPRSAADKFFTWADKLLSR